MSRSFAHVSLVGNLTRDPELRQTTNGTSVCQLGVAVGHSYKDASGQWQEQPSFFDVVVWGKQGEACAQYLTKGRQVVIDGRLQQRSWEAQDGTRRSKVEVVADQVVFSSGGGGGQQERPVQASAAQTSMDPAGSAAPANDYKDIDFGDDDDIPF
jgi:single-strand DNA-binding protein